MVASTFTTVTLLKFYVKWPPPSILRSAYSTSSLSPCNFDEVCQLNRRALLLGTSAKPGFYDFRNATRAPQCGNATRITAFAKVMRKFLSNAT